MTLHMFVMEFDSDGAYGVMSDDEKGQHLVILVKKDETGTGFHISPVEMHATYASASVRAADLNRG